MKKCLYIAKVKRLAFFLILIPIFSFSQWSTGLYYDSEKVAYASSPVYDNPIYIFVIKDLNTGKPYICIGMKTKYDATLTIDFQFDNVKLTRNIKRNYKYDFHEFTGKGYHFYGGILNPSLIISYLKKESFVKIKISTYSNVLNTKPVALEGSSYSINYVLGIKRETADKKSEFREDAYERIKNREESIKADKLKREKVYTRNNYFQEQNDKYGWVLIIFLAIIGFIILIFNTQGVNSTNKSNENIIDENNNYSELINESDEIQTEKEDVNNDSTSENATESFENNDDPVVNVESENKHSADKEEHKQKFCTNCGSPYYKVTAFCTNCGYKLLQ